MDNNISGVRFTEKRTTHEERILEAIDCDCANCVTFIDRTVLTYNDDAPLMLVLNTCSKPKVRRMLSLDDLVAGLFDIIDERDGAIQNIVNLIEKGSAQRKSK